MTTPGQDHYNEQMERYMAVVASATAEFRESMAEANELIRQFSETDDGRRLREEFKDAEQPQSPNPPPARPDGARHRRVPGIFD